MTNISKCYLLPTEYRILAIIYFKIKELNSKKELKIINIGEYMPGYYLDDVSASALTMKMTHDHCLDM